MRLFTQKYFDYLKILLVKRYPTLRVAISIANKVTLAIITLKIYLKRILTNSESGTN